MREGSREAAGSAPPPKSEIDSILADAWYKANPLNSSEPTYATNYSCSMLWLSYKIMTSEEESVMTVATMKNEEVHGHARCEDVADSVHEANERRDFMLKKMGSGSWHVEKRATYRSESFARDVDNVPETGCLSIVVLGASGDLAKKKTFPALFNLFRQGFLQPNEVHIFGYARTKISDDELRNRIRGYLINDKSSSPEQLEKLSKFLQLIKYVSGSYDSEESFQLLDKEISGHEVSRNSVEGSARRLFYLALPPSVYPSVCKMIRNHCTNKC
ncbi:glucose-6-phosphate 1-dehydrogenase 6, cytoplasmic isoform X2 [Fagus crenata]